MGTESNPYSDVGSVVTGSRFIGRKHEIHFLRQRVLNPVGYGSVAVIGLPKIGKTSLVHHVFRENEDELATKKTICVRLEVGEFDRWQSLFRAIMLETADAATRLSFGSPRLAEYTSSINTIASDEHLVPLVKTFFRCAHHDGIRPIVILDEFDAARYIFTGADRCFHILRELASNPDFKVGLVIVSKRELDEISRLAGHDSNYWANVLTTCYVRPFAADELQAFFHGLEKTAVELTETEKCEVVTRCGNHPFLLDLTAFDLVQRQQRGEGELIPQELDGEFIRLFESTCEVLKVGKRLSKIIQILVGPVYDTTHLDVEALMRYGVILRTEQGYSAFSRSFREYLSFVRQSVDIWPLWRETETSLRRAIESLLRGLYGEDWEGGITKARPQLAPIISACLTEKSKEKQKFGVHSSNHTLDYTYPNDLLAIMRSNWKVLGKPILGGEISDWAPKFAMLSKVRNPLAHNRDFSLTYERQVVEGYCREILERATEWAETNGVAF